MGDLIYATRGSYGFSLKRGITSESEEYIIQSSLDPKDFICRSMKFSNSGQYFCYCDSQRTVVVECSSGREILSADLPKTQQIIFSPRDRILVTYEPYVIYGCRNNADGSLRVPNPNLRFWSLSDGKLLATLISDKQASWQPQFTEDESIALRLSGSEMLFYKNGEMDKFVKKLVIKPLDSFLVSPGSTPYVLCFVPPTKGQPAVIQLRQLNLDSDMPIIYSKMSFNCDRCSMSWNCRGTAALVAAIVEVDKSDKSYYGTTHLFIISTRADSVKVELDKGGPLHDYKWAPSGQSFIVCYGFMPSKVAVYNVKGDVMWQHGEGHRNEVHYNPFGTILAICSFGNLASGKMEFWNTETREMINTFEVPSTTHFEWAPDGNHFVTATTAPRLRIGNGYRIWHYTAKCLMEQSYDEEGKKKEELWQVCWKPSKSYSKTEIAKLSAAEMKKNSNSIMVPKSAKHPIESLGLVGAVSKSGAYIPPAMRKQQQNQPSAAKPLLSEREKKIRNLEKKLEDIGKLKSRKAGGGTLELNQLQKLENEDSLRQELEHLKLSTE
jgi:translation initiation factor 2A